MELEFTEIYHAEPHSCAEEERIIVAIGNRNRIKAGKLPFIAIRVAHQKNILHKRK
jgi:hypothetical protein